MRGTVAGVSRRTVVAMAVASAGLAAAVAASPASAANLGAGLGMSETGTLYITGPAPLVGLFCPKGVEDGFICLYSGDDETGDGVALLVGNNQPSGKCFDMPTFVVDNFDNDTNRAMLIGDGTCEDKGPITDDDIPAGQDANVPPTDQFPGVK
jgi:hypothetical protein